MAKGYFELFLQRIESSEHAITLHCFNSNYCIVLVASIRQVTAKFDLFLLNLLVETCCLNHVHSSDAHFRAVWIAFSCWQTFLLRGENFLNSVLIFASDNQMIVLNYKISFAMYFEYT